MLLSQSKISRSSAAVGSSAIGINLEYWLVRTLSLPLDVRNLFGYVFGIGYQLFRTLRNCFVPPLRY